MTPIKALNRLPRRTPGRAATALALAGLAYAVAGMATQLTRERLRFRRDSGILYTRWTTIPAVTGRGKLRIHSRVRDVMTNARPIVLIHGFGIGSSYFVPLAAQLSRHAPVYAPDLPGHGSSDHDARPLDIPQLAAALGLWMDAMGLRHAVLVGHSLGCQVALHAAALRPELASRLVLIGPTADASARSVARQLLRSARTGAHERPGSSALMALDYARAGPGVLREELRTMLDDRPEDVVRRVAAPMVVVRGERDRIVSQHWAERLAHEAGAPAPVVVPGWGHAVHYDDPASVGAIILAAGRERDSERRSTPRG